MTPISVVVSRCDRIGDLVLSLPVLGFLRDAGVEHRILHCAPYCADIGEWALYNGLCTQLEIAGSESSRVESQSWGLALFHSQSTVNAFRKWGLNHTIGPRSKLATLWSYRHTVAQHRSQVKKSEMQYNIDLARALLTRAHIDQPQFKALPALALPPLWTSPIASPDLVVVVSNRGSAQNWPLDNYIKLAQERMRVGQSVHFLASGLDAAERKKGLIASGLINDGAQIVEDFDRLSQLITYLARAGEVFSSSTGPLHLAHAAGVAVTGVYPTARVQSFERWRPDGYWHSKAVRLIEIKDSH